jgi:bis(5'-nucleosyl)-tetraphosphatase (symmetrical)
MATYAIGDVQGCFDELRELLAKIRFGKQDRAWFVGDLVNRGPKSLEVLRFVRDLGGRAVTVLGNHDLHLVAQHEGVERPHKGDTFRDVLDAPDGGELIAWLRGRPMMHAEGAYAMVHAGLLPQWSIAKGLALGQEVERALAGPGYREFLANMYGGTPAQWDDALTGWDRLRVIVNAMTRMRFCNRDGRMDLEGKGTQPRKGYSRWYETRTKANGTEKATLLFGHWSQLGLVVEPGVIGLDSGCIWGGALSALRLEDRTLYQVACPGYQEPGN